MGSLLEGIDVKPHGERGHPKAAGAEVDPRKGVKIALALVLFVAAGILIWWQMQPAPIVTPPQITEAEPAAPAVNPSSTPTPTIHNGPQTFPR